MLSPTPPDKLVDPQGRPYFLWDCDMTLAEFRERLQDPDPGVRAYLLGKLMRQAKPDDVLTIADLETIKAHWTLVQKHLGNSREFWRWLLRSWNVTDANE
jgi:hypothetical protein